MKESSVKLAPAAGQCDPLLLMPGHKLSALIKEGSLTSVRLCQVYIERIKQVQPKINCMAQNRFERALLEARVIDELVAQYRTIDTTQETNLFSQEQLERLRSPLLGVPISIKESIQVEGMINSCGVVERRAVYAERDAVVVTNVKRAGMVPICTTNIPELTLFWSDCHNNVYGRALNPYDRTRVTGASSGGEAGLIAAAGSLLGIGSDVGGSLRSPAHCCGIFSHKPSPFLVSPEGNFPALKEARLRMFTLGPMCRYASDLKYLMKSLVSDAIRGDNLKCDTYTTHQPKDITQLRTKLVAQLDDLSQAVDLTQIKLFYCNFERVNLISSLIGQRETSVDSEIRELQREVCDYLVGKFHCQLVEINLDKYMDNIFEIWNSMLLCGATVDHEQAYEVDEAKRLFGISNVSLELFKWLMGVSDHTKETILTLLFGIPVPSERNRAYNYCSKAERRASEIRTELEAQLGPMGVIVMPTLPTVAHKHHISLIKTNETRFPCLFNVVQFPATHATMRLDTQHKLPIGLTFASRPYNDHLTIALAEEIEQAFGGWTFPNNLIKSTTSKNDNQSHEEKQ